MKSPFATLYASSPMRHLYQKEHWKAPDVLPHATPTVIAEIPADPGGRAVRVLCEALPAEFFTIEALASDGLKPFALSTGSGCARLVAEMAYAVASGMLTANEP